MVDIILAVLLFLLAIIFFFMGVRSFKEKGFLLNNAYIYASKRAREQMVKKPYYRQTAIVFFALGIVFLLNGLALLLQISAIYYIVLGVILLTIFYAILSSIWIECRRK